MWAKKNDHAPEIGCAGFFNICPKRVFLKKIKFVYSLVFSWLYLLNLSKMWLANLLITIATRKNE